MTKKEKGEPRDQKADDACNLLFVSLRPSRLGCLIYDEQDSIGPCGGIAVKGCDDKSAVENNRESTHGARACDASHTAAVIVFLLSMLFCRSCLASPFGLAVCQPVIISNKHTTSSASGTVATNTPTQCILAQLVPVCASVVAPQDDTVPTNRWLEAETLFRRRAGLGSVALARALEPPPGRFSSRQTQLGRGGLAQLALPPPPSQSIIFLYFLFAINNLWRSGLITVVDVPHAIFFSPANLPR